MRDISNLQKELQIVKQVLFQIRNQRLISHMKILKKNINPLTLVLLQVEMGLKHPTLKRVKQTLFNINLEVLLKTMIKGESWV